ncbi:UvrD-helicase domain-containing protein [Arthrobacter sp. H14-L1]|uniref:UvrD-helicase domain-containing protein n=1 Tax=Arthrobacter sp. H14-L1 TaxID=2996697 RepID=UPI00226E7D37|nr:UvrD-helicase domain-containing protein [Arthrobacter sp. H14-L1]MCY0905867.1 UvrD-helicase domain-containing protein [Arthrobacter sp. H14-L1]
MSRLDNVTMVSASAGTGKTYTLTTKIVEQIEAGVPAASIMATTFTKKAAGELRERIAGRLLDRASEAGGGTGAGGGMSALDLAAQELGSSLIGTVNSVCGQLLQEYAIDAGLSPALEVIGEEQLDSIFRLATDEVLAAHAPEILPVAHRLGFDGTGARDAATWEDTVRSIVDAARTNLLTAADLPACADRSWAGLRQLLDTPGADRRPEWLTQLRAAESELEQVLASGLMPNGKKANVTSAGFLDQHPKLLAKLATLRDVKDVPWEVWRGFCLSSPAGPLKPIFLSLRQDIHAELLANPALHEDLEGYIRGVFVCAAECLEAYQEFKDAHGLMDFVDQEARVLQLAQRNEAFRRAFAGRIRFLVVDEFQDTSPLQLALFLELSSLAEQAVWVGDPKQAIYGFRGADPELMEAVVRQVPRREQLSYTWRSQQHVIDLSNTVFEQVFAEHGMSPESVHLELPPGRSGNPVGHLEAWTRPQTNDGERLRATAAGVASLLARHRDLRPCDVAVLARSNADVLTISAALDGLGLRASRSARTLGSAREVQLARAAMAYVADAYDTVALTELVAIHPGHPDHGTWQQELLATPGPAAVLASWKTAPVLATLGALRADASSASPTAVFEAVVGALGLSELIAGWSTPETRLRNLDALRGSIDQYYERCLALRSPATLRGFLDFFAGEEQQSAENSGPDVVNVLTYHKAKGLEWKAVVLEALDKDLRFSSFGPAVVQDVALNLAQPLAGRWVRFWPSPFPYGGSPLDERAKTSSVAQEAEGRERRNMARLMYVGMSRAKEITVLTGKNGTPALLNNLGVPDLMSWRAETGDDAADAGTGAGANGVILVGGDTRLAARVETLEPAAAVPPVRTWTPRYIDLSQPPAAVRKAARLKASSLGSAGIGAQVHAVAELGPRLAQHGSDDWGAVGSAVHAYLGTEFRSLNETARIRSAERLVQRWGVSQTVRADLLLAAGERFEAYLDAEFSGWKRHREAAIGWRPQGQTMEGWIDLLLEGPDGYVLVDHKTYPGSDPVGHIRAKYLGQMKAYADAIEAATGKPVQRVLMHLPAVGNVYEVSGLG